MDTRRPREHADYLAFARGAFRIHFYARSGGAVDVSSYYQMIVKGVIIVIAVLFDRKSDA
jgi:ribose/xylose/arabinose/galactoside ABC-type transport system permease subunit